MRLLGRTLSFAGRHPAVQERDRLRITCLREARTLTAGKVARPATGEARMLTRSVRGHHRAKSVRTRCRHNPVPNAAFHVQYVGPTGNSASGEHGQTQPSEPRIQISGSTSTLANQSDFFAQTVKVRYASSYGSSTFGGGMLPRSP